MSTKWHCGALGCAFMFLAAAGIPGCDEMNEELNDGVLKNAVVADDDHIDFTPVDDEVTFRSTVDNGIESNGTRFNGTKFNGRKFNGTKFNGTKFNGARGTSGLRRYLGSVSSQVVAESDCSVTVVRASVPQASADDPR